MPDIDTGPDASGAQPVSWTSENLGLTLRETGRSGRWSLTDLVTPGLRRNPRRAHLWVSRVLGKHIPAPPDMIASAAHDLADLVAASGAFGVHDASDCMVFGFAETATGLGHCVARRLDARTYLHSTRRTRPAAPTVARFEEGHSHATDHRVQPSSREMLRDGQVLVLVDDEMSTGATALAAIERLHAVAPRVRYVVACLVDMRSAEDRRRFADTAAGLGVDVEVVSLAQGEGVIPPDLPDRVAALSAAHDDASSAVRRGPRGDVTRLRTSWPPEAPDGGRHGFTHTDHVRFDDHAHAVADHLATVVGRRPVVVIGHEESMYLPLRIATDLQDRGLPVTSQTTTRSPAHVVDHPTYPLRAGWFFTPAESTTPSRARRHLYNAHHDDPDVLRVVVVDPVADTPALSAAGGLLDALTRDGRDVLVVTAGGARFDDLARARSRSS